MKLGHGSVITSHNKLWDIITYPCMVSGELSVEEAPCSKTHQDPESKRLWGAGERRSRVYFPTSSLAKLYIVHVFM